MVSPCTESTGECYIQPCGTVVYRLCRITSLPISCSRSVPNGLSWVTSRLGQSFGSSRQISVRGNSLWLSGTHDVFDRVIVGVLKLNISADPLLYFSSYSNFLLHNECENSQNSLSRCRVSRCFISWSKQSSVFFATL